VKAIVFPRPGEIAFDARPMPEPTDGDVLVEVRLVGLCGSDLSSFRGKNPLVSYPRVPGHEVAGIVAEAGPDRPDLRPGVRVTLSPYTSCGRCASCRRGRPNACAANQTFGVQRDGALTEYVRVPAAKVFPSSLGLEELCLVEPLTVGFHAIGRARVAVSDVVAVFGCGGVGLGAIAGAAARGARIAAVDTDDAKLEVARAAGATHTVNAERESPREALLAVTDGLGPDVVVEAIGIPETYRLAVETVAFTGRVVYVGYAKESVTYETRLFVQKELDVLGSRNALPEDFRAVIRMLEERKFPVGAAISAVVPFEAAPDAIREWSEHPGRFTKILVQLT
jgi:2-desacetyl-2-hydroxyethyl bacteriochlorophyllide A dehydrogenase